MDEKIWDEMGKMEDIGECLVTFDIILPCSECLHVPTGKHLSPLVIAVPEGPRRAVWRCRRSGYRDGTGPISDRRCSPGLRRSANPPTMLAVSSAPDRSCHHPVPGLPHVVPDHRGISFSFLSPGRAGCGDSGSPTKQSVRHSMSSTWPRGIMWPCQRLSPAVGSPREGLDRRR